MNSFMKMVFTGTTCRCAGSGIIPRLVAVDGAVFMNNSNEIARQRLVEFLAERLKARGLEPGGTRQAYPIAQESISARSRAISPTGSPGTDPLSPKLAT
jgi:hypothetical protein